METVVVFVVKSSSNDKVNKDDALSANPSLAVLRTFPLCKLCTVRQLLPLIPNTASYQNHCQRKECV